MSVIPQKFRAPQVTVPLEALPKVPLGSRDGQKIRGLSQDNRSQLANAGLGMVGIGYNKLAN